MIGRIYRPNLWEPYRHDAILARVDIYFGPNRSSRIFSSVDVHDVYLSVHDSKQLDFDFDVDCSITYGNLILAHLPEGLF